MRYWMPCSQGGGRVPGKFLKKKSERFLYKFTMPRHDELTSENPPPFFLFFFMALLWMASAAASSRVKFRQRLNASEANFSSKKKKSAFSILIYLCKGTMYWLLKISFLFFLFSCQLSCRYKMLTAASVGGLSVVCPESSSDEDCARLMIPPMQVCNSFSANVEFARLAAAVRLSSRIRGVEQVSLITDCRSLFPI